MTYMTIMDPKRAAIEMGCPAAKERPVAKYTGKIDMESALLARMQAAGMLSKPEPVKQDRRLSDKPHSPSKNYTPEEHDIIRQRIYDAALGSWKGARRIADELGVELTVVQSKIHAMSKQGILHKEGGSNATKYRTNPKAARPGPRAKELSVRNSMVLRVIAANPGITHGGIMRATGLKKSHLDNALEVLRRNNLVRFEQEQPKTPFYYYAK